MRTGLPAAAVLGAAPALWYFFGSYEVLEHEAGILDRITSGEVGRFMASLLDHAWWRTRFDILVFAAAGVAVTLRDARTRRHPLRILTLVALQFGLLAITGIWDPENLRLTFFPTILLVPYAAHAARLASGWLAARVRRGIPSLHGAWLPERVLLTAAAAGFAWLAYTGAAFTAGTAAEPVYRAGYAAAAAFEGEAFTGVLVLTDAPAGPYVFATYSEVPLESIFELGPTTLDHRIDGSTAAGLRAAGISHVVAAYANAAGLSPEELKFLEMLGSGELPNTLVSQEGPRIWRLAARDP